MFTKIPQENEAAVKVSYVLSELIAKYSKPFTEGDFIKTCLIKSAEIIYPGNLKAFKNISLTRNTVAYRITDLTCNLSDQIKIKIPSFEYFSIACGESIDIGGTALSCVFSLLRKDVFVSVFKLLKKYDLPLAKLSSVATDGAHYMTGENKGFVETRCVRCGALHSSSACTSPRDATPKCALCSGDHPSNYKGCSVYKELQLRNKPKMSSPLLGNLSHKKNVQVSQPMVTPLAHSSDSSQTYAQATSGTHPNNIIPPPVSDINKFLDEFKLLINPLIALLTQVISKLLEKN
ncbi:Hypothetical protein CINCED_3A016878 [Cinara cedri]|uniref:Uncharacterized protein n=1 Tax=Cinara cedri TaxID=506608 RepID=A0A5E4MD52_9HEMI|nr:Hypothetical protein CINCED_3A016878 [Cinara cedri]